MRKDSILRALKQSFQGAVPESDGRVNLPHLDFITGLVFCFLGDTKSFGLEAIRRFLIATFERPISKGAFWERLSRNRLKGILHDLMGRWMNRLSSATRIGEELVQKLMVGAIYLLDSSSITLWDGACESYPGTRTDAAIKWHACFERLSGRMTWFGITAASVHDRKCFPDIQSLAGKLILFDLGYWDYGLLMRIEAAKGFFLSRVKSNAAIGIIQVIHGLSTAAVGSKLSALTFKRKRKAIIELLGEIVQKGQAKVYRVMGFWNPVEKQYPWYLTHLSVAAHLLYPLYRLRWQIELIFKASKRSFNLDKRLTSNNDNIIESLILSSIIASFASCVVFEIGVQQLTEKELGYLCSTHRPYCRLGGSRVHSLFDHFISQGCRRPGRKDNPPFQRKVREKPSTSADLFRTVKQSSGVLKIPNTYDASLSFDYLSTKVIDKSTGDAGLSALVEHFARLGAPLITGIDDVYALADELGLDVIHNVLSADLHRWHWPTRAMNANVLGFYSLCTLATRSGSARITQSRSARAIFT